MTKGTHAGTFSFNPDFFNLVKVDDFEYISIHPASSIMMTVSRPPQCFHNPCGDQRHPGIRIHSDRPVDFTHFSRFW
jgi:hypothetical protein